MNAETASSALDGIDLTATSTHIENLSSLWATLQRDRPVAWHSPPKPGAPGFWVVTRHSDVTDVLKDSACFGSSRGNVLATLMNGGDSAGGRMLAVSDGPRHQTVRRSLAVALTPKALTNVVASMRAAVDRLVRSAVEQGECDFATHVAKQIPMTAICDLLDIPEADRARLQKYTSAALAADTSDSKDMESSLARNEMLLYFSRLARKRGKLVTDDLFGRLVALTSSPPNLSEDELILNCYSLMLGGDETARLAIIGSLKALHDYPEQWAILHNGDCSMPLAVEELLRWTTPALHAGRTATQETRIHGQAIKAGDVVTAWMVVTIR